MLKGDGLAVDGSGRRLDVVDVAEALYKLLVLVEVAEHADTRADHVALVVAFRGLVEHVHVELLYVLLEHFVLFLFAKSTPREGFKVEIVKFL